MTKIPSVEERFVANYLDGDKIQDGQMLSSRECLDAITADRLALLTELRESGLLKEKELEGELDINRKRQFRGYNTLARNIKAHLDELIKSNSI